MDIKKLERNDLINNIGKEQYTTNTEAGEFSYISIVDKDSKEFKEIQEKIKRSNGAYIVDLRFEHIENISLIIETKSRKFKKEDYEQLEEYYALERIYRPNNNVIAVLFNLQNPETAFVKVYDKKNNKETTFNKFDYNKKIYEY
ncbi:hypothetical protein ACXYRO_04135 [Mycoplasma sp. 4013]